MNHRLVKLAKGEIPTASMADLAFLLIVFFMLTSVITSNKGVDYTLAEGDEDPNSPITVEITQHGNVILQGRIFAPSEMEAFAEEIARLANAKSQLLAIIIADDGCAYGDTIRIMDVLKLQRFEIALPLGKERDFFR